MNEDLQRLYLRAIWRTLNTRPYDDAVRALEKRFYGFYDENGNPIDNSPQSTLPRPTCRTAQVRHCV